MEIIRPLSFLQLRFEHGLKQGVCVSIDTHDPEWLYTIKPGSLGLFRSSRVNRTHRVTPSV